MKKIDEISSTESLLETIRKKRSGEIEALSWQMGDPHSLEFPSSGRLSRGRKTGLSLGVLIGRVALSMVVVARGKDAPAGVREYRKIPYPPGVSPKNPDFSAFLKSCIDRLHYAPGSLRVWSCIPGEKVEIRYFRIPHVPEDKAAAAALWTYRKELNSEERGVRTGELFDETSSVFDFEILGDVTENGVQKREVVAWSVPRRAVKDFQALFDAAGYPLNGITTLPFSIQNLFRNNIFRKQAGCICTVSIGHNFTRISIFFNGSLVLDRQIRMGIVSMATLLADAGYDSEPDENDGELRLESAGEVSVEPGVAQDILEAWAFKAESGELEEPLGPIASVVKRLASHIEWTLAHCARNVTPEPVEQIRFYGVGGTCRPIGRAISGLTGIRVDDAATVPRVPGGDSFTLDRKKVGKDGEFMPVLGLALAQDDVTPNFLRNYVIRRREKLYRRVEKVIVAVFLGIMLCLGGVARHDHGLLAGLEHEKHRLEEELGTFPAGLNRDLIAGMVGQREGVTVEMKRFVSSYRGVALINEISRKTPRTIRITGLTVDFPSSEAKGDGNRFGEKNRAAKRLATLKGRVTTDRRSLDSALAGYLAEMAVSPLVSGIDLRSKRVETVNDKEVLVFTAQLELM